MVLVRKTGDGAHAGELRSRPVTLSAAFIGFDCRDYGDCVSDSQHLCALYGKGRNDVHRLLYHLMGIQVGNILRIRKLFFQEMEMKTVSVVMATYNGEQYLSEQIDSILAQSYPVHELIIQDDCSTDGTTDIVRRYMEKYPFVKLFVNERNVGYNENFRRAAMHATGDFVALSDQDDIWFPQKLERQVAAIGDADICFSNTLDGERLESSKPYPDRRFTLETTIWRNQISGHTML